jgi:hypothetical protein
VMESRLIFLHHHGSCRMQEGRRRVAEPKRGSFGSNP